MVSFADIGHCILGISLLVFIAGFAMAFSKKERERARARATADLPERAILINTPDADKIAQRRGYYMLALGIILFIVWLWFFGPSNLIA